MRAKKVLIGMSGGVDSSVAAALLKEQGYEVVGVTMQVWEEEDPHAVVDGRACCSLWAVEDARRVAAQLDIPYYVMNFKDIFKEKVVDYFQAEYLQGRTPNPCVACNRYIKFDALLEKAISMGIDYVATGHYARREYDSNSGRYIIKKAADTHKDQTYALYTLTQEQLKRTLLPLGDYTKEEIRKIAEDIGLQIASKPDSQEICFVPDNDYAGFIERNTGKTIEPGNFVDIYGKVLGRHRGIIHYTIGQRKGLGISLGRPTYVVRIDPKTNTVVLGDNGDVFAKGLVASDLNFMSIDGLESSMDVKAKIRYSARETPATIRPIGEGSIEVLFEEPERAITPGQSVVFYDGDIVVGGGTIDRVMDI